LDHFFTGVNTAITGKYGDTITSQLLQMGGVSAENATTIDHLMSIGGSIGGARLAMNAVSSSFSQTLKSAGHLGMDEIKYVSKTGIRDLGQKNQDIPIMLQKHLGQNSRAFHNKYGDLIIESQDGLKQFRIDLNHTNPHKNPHSHIIGFIKNNGKKEELFNKRIYPIDVIPE
ncbi:MAG: hypothetical protein ACH350_08110, partial [Parachlamydiaceae bacterium]